MLTGPEVPKFFLIYILERYKIDNIISYKKYMLRKENPMNNTGMTTETPKLKIFLWEPSGVNRPDWPLTFGVPFPKGAIHHEREIRLWDEGNEIPVAAKITAQWPDGSVRFLLLDFQVDLRGNEKKYLDLEYGPNIRSSAVLNPVINVTERQGEVIVSNGSDLTVTFKSGERMPFADISFKGQSLLSKNFAFCSLIENGKTFGAVEGIGHVIVEDQNNFRAVVRMDGVFTAPDNRHLLNLTTRVYVYAGRPFLRIYHTLTNLEGRDVLLENLSFRLPALFGDSAGFLTGHGLDETLWSSQNSKIALTLKTVEVPETRYRRETLAPHIACPRRLPEIEGTAEQVADSKALIQTEDGRINQCIGFEVYYPLIVTGLLCGRGIRFALGCRNFQSQAPAKVEVDRDQIHFSLYWNGDSTPLTLWRGTAKTHELFLQIESGEPPSSRDDILAYKRQMVALEEPAVPTFGETNWLAKTQALGPMLSYRPEKYPWLEFTFRSVFEKWHRPGPRGFKGSTVLDFGDYWNPMRGGQWQNNEMDMGAGFLLFLMRTGYPLPFRDAEAMIHHMIDVDTHHEAAETWWTGAQRCHQVRHGAFSGPALCHQWLEGPIYLYLLTGYERAKEIALARANHFCIAIEKGVHRVKQLERVQGWPLVALATINEIFPDERYVKCCELILDWLEEWMVQDGDLVYPYLWPIVEGHQGGSILGRGVISQALARYHRMTNSPRAWNLLVRIMNLAKETLFTPEGLGTKTSLLRRNYFAPGESDFILEPMGYLWEKTGDLEWVRLALLNFKLAVLQRNVLGKEYVDGVAEILTFWPVFLDYADRSGLLEDLRII